MASIPKSPLRGNGPDPKPAAGAFRRPMLAIPELEESDRSWWGQCYWDALDACQEICVLLGRYFDAWGGLRYSPDLDQRYRALWKRAIQPLGGPEFVAQFVPLDVLQPSLAFFPSGDMWWLNTGQPTIQWYQAHLLMALDHWDVPRPVPCGPALASDAGTEANGPVLGCKSPEPNMATAKLGKTANRATRRSATRRTRALTMKAKGDTIKAIAFALNVSERTIYNYLRDPNQEG
jgi:hypothetical protein